jgi:hypothetical protein
MMKFKLDASDGEPSLKVLPVETRINYRENIFGSESGPLFSKPKKSQPRRFARNEEEEKALYIRDNNQALAKTCLGGLRGDPFDTLPIPNRGHVPSAFDYCEEGLVAINGSAD